MILDEFTGRNCNVPHRRATSATKERAYLKHDGFVARLQREDATKQEEV